MYYEIFIKDVVVDEILNTPVLDVRFVGHDGSFKIWVGPYEGTSIADALCESKSPRPNTHDITSKLISVLGANLEKVIIGDIIDNTFHADIILIKDGYTKVLDIRPGDAIAIALRLHAPIFVTRKVLKRISGSDEDLEGIRKILNKQLTGEIKPEDFL